MKMPGRWQGLAHCATSGLTWPVPLWCGAAWVISTVWLQRVGLKDSKTNTHMLRSKRKLARLSKIIAANQALGFDWVWQVKRRLSRCESVHACMYVTPRWRPEGVSNVAGGELFALLDHTASVCVGLLQALRNNLAREWFCVFGWVRHSDAA